MKRSLQVACLAFVCGCNAIFGFETGVVTEDAGPDGETKDWDLGTSGRPNERPSDGGASGKSGDATDPAFHLDAGGLDAGGLDDGAPDGDAPDGRDGTVVPGPADAPPDDGSEVPVIPPETAPREGGFEGGPASDSRDPTGDADDAVEAPAVRDRLGLHGKVVYLKQKGLYRFTYDFSTPSQIDDFTALTINGTQSQKAYGEEGFMTFGTVDEHFGLVRWNPEVVVHELKFRARLATGIFINCYVNSDLAHPAWQMPTGWGAIMYTGQGNSPIRNYGFLYDKVVRDYYEDSTEYVKNRYYNWTISILGDHYIWNIDDPTGPDDSTHEFRPSNLTGRAVAPTPSYVAFGAYASDEWGNGSVHFDDIVIEGELPTLASDAAPTASAGTTHDSRAETRP